MFEYTVTAAHRTRSNGYIDVYITRDTWQMELDRAVTWNDLEESPICHWVPETYPTPIQKGGPMEAYPCTIPHDKIGKHVLFMVWQRDDSQEAFYSCSDVVLENPENSDSTTRPDTKSTTISTTDFTAESTTELTTESTEPCETIDFKGPVLSDSTIRPFQSNLCIYAATFTTEQDLTTLYCSPEDSRFKWKFDASSGQISSVSRPDLCWTLPAQNGIWQHVKLSVCDEKDVLQKLSWQDGKLHSLANIRLCIGFDSTQMINEPEHSNLNDGYTLTTTSCFSNVWGGLQ